MKFTYLLFLLFLVVNLSFGQDRQSPQPYPEPQNTPAQDRLEEAIEANRSLYGTEDNPNAGTTRDPKWQADYDKASEEFNRRQMEGPLPDYVLRALEAIPDQPGK